MSVEPPPPPPLAQMPTKVRLDTFTEFHMKHTIISPEFESHELKGNQKARGKIDGYLFNNMRYVFRGLHEVDTSFNAANASGLLIEPVIEEIKFVGGAQRFWAGSMAGNSFVKIKVTFRDIESGNILAEPEFYRSGNAFAGSYSMGGTDNEMLRSIAHDVCDYARHNR